MSNAYALGRRNDSKDTRTTGRLLTAGVIAAAACIAVYLIVRFLLMPLTVVKNVTVESDTGLTRAEITKLMGLGGGESWFTLDTAAVQKGLESNVLVRQARVEKVFPDSLRIYLYRREAAGLVLAETGGRTVPVLVDRGGVSFKVGAAAGELDVPVVSGPPLGEAALGSTLPPAYVKVFADLAALKAKSPSLYGLISEVRIVSGTGGGSEPPEAVSAGPGSAATSSASVNPELLLFLITSPVPVRARGTVDESLVKYALMVMDLLSGQGVLKDIGELDFRGGDVVYRMKEG